MPIPEGCRIALDHLECPPEAVEELRASLCPGRGRCSAEELRAELEALREILDDVLVKVEGVVREAAEAEELVKALAAAREAAQRILRLYQRLEAGVRVVEGWVRAWYCYAIVPHEEPVAVRKLYDGPRPTRLEDRYPDLAKEVKKAREKWRLRVLQLPLLQLGHDYIALSEEHARRFLSLYERVFGWIVEELRRRGVNTRAAAQCIPIRLAPEHAAQLLEEELQRLQREIVAIEGERLVKRLSGREITNYKLQKLRALRERAAALQAILARVKQHLDSLKVSLDAEA